MILGLFKVSGHSMEPLLKINTRVLISSIPYYFSEPKIHDVILFVHKGKHIIKRISRISKNKIYVRGDNIKDSMNIGPINKKEIKGKMLYKIDI